MLAWRTSLLIEFGFTFIELTVTVAVIGLLAAIAVPAYDNYSAKGKTAEAKINLSSAYSLMKSFQSESTSNTACLLDLGYSPEGTRWYSSGIDSGRLLDVLCGPNGDTACSATGWNGSIVITSCQTTSGLLATRGIDNGHAECPLYRFSALTSSVSTNAFTIGATGCISNKSGAVDTWTINQSKLLVNSAKGY